MASCLFVLMAWHLGSGNRCTEKNMKCSVQAGVEFRMASRGLIFGMYGCGAQVHKEITI